MTFEESVHNVSLTGNEIYTILDILEGYNPLDANGYDPEYREDIDNILERLEEVADNYYTQLEEINELKSALNDGGKVI